MVGTTNKSIAAMCRAWLRRKVPQVWPDGPPLLGRALPWFESYAGQNWTGLLCCRSAIADRHARGLGKPESFDFLGFTHYCATRRSGSGFVLGRKPVAKRMRAKRSEEHTSELQSPDHLVC